jgi:hypothetical protein
MGITQSIYEDICRIRYISTDEFSKEWLGMNPSYYRSIKARGMEASTAALLVLMDKLHAQSCAHRANTGHQLLQRVADQYTALAHRVGEEVARRSTAAPTATAWVRSTLVKIINELNEQRMDADQNPYRVPPIIIC